MSAVRKADDVAERPFPRIVPRRLAPAGSLCSDALAGVPAATHLFDAPPGRLPDAPTVEGRAGVGSALPTEAFKTTSAGAAERLARVLAGEGVVVTTGQQPGLFLGPLYTIYKALTAVRLAGELERSTGRPALAVFWVASDDHDWNEVATCRIVDAEEEIATLRIDPPVGWATRSVGQAPLPASVTDLLQRFGEEAGGAVAGSTPRWMDALREAYEPGQSFGAAFAQALGAAVEGLDLAILDSAQPAVRKQAAGLYRRVVEEPEAMAQAMRDGLRAVREAGYEPALTPPPEGLQMFYDDGEARRHVLRTNGDEFAAGDWRPDRAALLRRLDQAPDEFTPAAALRPVLESRLLPVAATVLGPGEIAYWAQLLPLFADLEIPMPAILPRDAWVLVEPRVDRLLEKLDLDVATVEREGKGIDDRWIARSRPPGVRDGLAALERDLADGFERLTSAVDRELPGLKSAAGKAAHRAARALEEFGRTVDGRVRERESIALAQAARIRAHLLPDGRPQERTVAAAQFLSRHGRALVRDLFEAGRVAGPEEQD